MKRITTLLAVAVACCSLLPAARGGIVAVPGNPIPAVAPPFGAPDAALGAHPWTAYQLTVKTDDGSLISAVDVSLGGTFHQRWADVDFDGVPDSSPVGPPANGRGDSHLTPIAGALIGSAPSEDNNVSASPLPDTFVPFVGGFDYGAGSFLTGAWGIPGASQTDTADLAYIVIPTGSELDDSTLSVVIQVATSNGTFTIGRTAFFIPEPSTMALAGLALCGIVIGRRKS